MVKDFNVTDVRFPLNLQGLDAGWDPNRSLSTGIRAEGAFRSTTNRILGLEKSRFALIALVWLFESLDEVRAISFRQIKKF